MTARVGDPAPAFTLAATEGTPESRRDIVLDELRGEPVVLAFYPADASPVCTQQLRSYSNDIGRFADVGAQVLAISPQSIRDHERFIDSLGGLSFPLLSDADKSVGERYGVLGPIGFYKRSVFVIDAAGIVRWAHRATAGLTFRPVDEIVGAIRAASAPAG